MRSFLCFFRFFAVWNTEFFSRMVIELLGGVRAPFQVQSRCQIDHGLGCPISRTKILKRNFHEFGWFHQLRSILNVVVMLCGKDFHGSCPKWPFHYGLWWKESDFVLTLHDVKVRNFFVYRTSHLRIRKPWCLQQGSFDFWQLQGLTWPVVLVVYRMLTPLCTGTNFSIPRTILGFPWFSFVMSCHAPLLF